MSATALKPALIGRDAGLARLRDRLVDAALFSRGSVVLMAGEHGAGKTRLIAEVEREARTWGVRFLNGTGDPERPDLPCGLFLGVLRDYLKYSEPRERRALRETIAELAPQLWEPLFPYSRRQPSPSDREPNLRQALFLARLGQLLLASCQQRPTVLCLEDLHWADPTSLQLLFQLAGKGAAVSLLVVGTYRPEVRIAANDVNLGQVVWEFCRYPHFEHLRLERLSLAQTRVVLYSCFAQSAFSEDLVEQLHRQSGGVPLFIVQHLEHLRREGVLYQDRGGVWVNRPVAEVGIPVSTRAALQQQLRGLSEEQRAILSCAAAQGESFAGVPLAQAMGWPLIKVLWELGRLERTIHLVRRSERGFCFAHPLLAAIFCELLPEAQSRHCQLRLPQSEEAQI